MSFPASSWKRLEEAKRKLLEHRYGRIRPALDDKVLLGWNALMNMACSKAYGALGVAEYRDWAIANMRFLKEQLRGEGLYFYFHAYNRERGGFPPSWTTMPI